MTETRAKSLLIETGNHLSKMADEAARAMYLGDAGSLSVVGSKLLGSG